jgi:hypothetical protein
MPSLRSLRKVLHYLVLASLLAGPFGVGAAAASSAAKACDSTCPCDGAEASEVEAADDTTPHCHDGLCNPQTEEAPAPCAEHDAHGPCADDCPDCSCCPGFMVAAVPSFVIPYFPPPHPIMIQTSLELSIMSFSSGTFRPPQSSR